MKRYILEGHNIKEEPDLIAWAKSFEASNRHVAKDLIDGVTISTVFLGIDHSFFGGTPVLFETMVFGGTHDQEQERYYTWDEAIKGHNKMVNKIKLGE